MSAVTCWCDYDLTSSSSFDSAAMHPALVKHRRSNDPYHDMLLQLKMQPKTARMMLIGCRSQTVVITLSLSNLVSAGGRLLHGGPDAGYPDQRDRDPPQANFHVMTRSQRMLTLDVESLSLHQALDAPSVGHSS